MFVASSRPAERPKILLTGTTGQIGGDLYPLLTTLGDVLATDRRSLDLSHAERVRDCVRSFRPHVIVNAAAHTAVDKAESEPDAAHMMNTLVPGVLAQEAAELGALLIHFSTDYVFDGRKSAPYVESDPVNPLNVYGSTKAAGEEAIMRSGCAHLILRTSWVYSPRGSNFLLTILRLAREREELRIVDDQIGAPTSSRSIAVATVQALQHCIDHAEAIQSGIYHLTATGNCSWYGFASEIIRTAEMQDWRLRNLVPIPSTEYVSPARRPLNSRLDCSKLFATFRIKMAEWHVSLQSVLEDVLATSSRKTEEESNAREDRATQPRYSGTLPLPPMKP